MIYYMPDCIFTVLERTDTELKLFFSKTRTKTQVEEALKRKNIPYTHIQSWHSYAHPAPITTLWRVTVAPPQQP